ncbi:MAG: hypothetical protein ACI9G1_000782 [Pirellulaceae bacterium]|jgi:hypothetical protein
MRKFAAAHFPSITFFDSYPFLTKEKLHFDIGRAKPV